MAAKEFDEYQHEAEQDFLDAYDTHVSSYRDWLDPMLVNFLAAIRLGYDRHQRYGAQNILKFKEQGIAIRLSDKMERLIKLIFDPPPEIDSVELRASIKDTFGDIINYAFYGLMCIDIANGEPQFALPSAIDPSHLVVKLMPGEHTDD